MIEPAGLSCCDEVVLSLEQGLAIAITGFSGMMHRLNFRQLAGHTGAVLNSCFHGGDLKACLGCGTLNTK
ncbi:MAG: hypothetical protein GY712_07525 [Oceanicoccus sp.]|uniref:hypothetical protein n=1 Tax=Oceanicoccus sp. TaxID=2691044 RepID=UPI002625733C|nr:hypothetical protein [Oceanicoccus sp.]MCP3907852.1 hypothetical protein [Oceanicoccus sp.]